MAGQEVVFKACGGDRKKNLLEIADALEAFFDRQIGVVRAGVDFNSRKAAVHSRTDLLQELHSLKGLCEQLRIIADEQPPTKRQKNRLDNLVMSAVMTVDNEGTALSGEIMKALQKQGHNPKRNSVLAILSLMVHHGQLRRLERGVYEAPGHK